MQPPPAQQQRPESSAHRRASSSSACFTAPRRTTIGCMAGLLRLFSPYHRSHHRKRLTAKNNAKQQQPSSPEPSSTPTKKKAEAASPSPVFLSPVKPKPTQQQQPAVVWRRRSCDAPRSPTIAPEHRRSSCDSPRPPPSAIVARLMGLEESAPSSPAATAQRPVVLPTRPPPSPPPPETAAEKQRKLLDALEKCDEDLKTLRRIIAAVHSAEMRAAAAAPDVVVASVAAGTTAMTTPRNKDASAEWLLCRRDEQSPSPSPQQQQYNRNKPRGEEQYPSPDSVLDIIVSSPRLPCRKRPSPSTDAVSGTAKIVKPSRTFVFSGDYCKTKAGDELPKPHTAVGAHHPHPAVPAEACTLPTRLPWAAGAESWRHQQRRWELEAAAAGRVINRAMAESVGEVWGQHPGGAAEWECGWVAAALERVILQDMVSDVVAELLAQSGRGHGAGCRKRLLF